MIFLIAIQKEELFLKRCNILIFFSLAWNIFDRVELKKNDEKICFVLSKIQGVLTFLARFEI